MNYLSVEGLTKTYPHRVLFENINFGISKGEKVALIAKNGAGKSSLLKILKKDDTPKSGTFAFNKEIKVAFLEQTPVLNESLTVLDAIYENPSPIVQAIRNYETELNNDPASDKFNTALEQMEILNAWDYEARLKEMLSFLKINNFEQRIGELSGGQKKRIALAQVLLDEPDFLILDEPTNHLDLDIIHWLEGYLERSQMTLLMVTHDRYFLECVCNTILELDQGNLYRYTGNYSYYLEQKALREELEATGIQKAKNLMSKELEWIRRQPKARGTKAKYRVEAFDDIKKEATKHIDKSKLEIDLQTKRIGKKILEIEHISKRFGDFCAVDNFEYTFKRGDKIGVVGKNGVGKTTFLNLISGKEEVDSGIITPGETIKMGYYKQENEDLDPNKKVIDCIKDIAEFIPLASGGQISASQMLEKFLFPGTQQYSPVDKLSGGEKKRLYLLQVLMSNPNFLILDEPTNDLDIVTLNILEDYLESFPGCIMIVSHDRYFMDKLVDQLFVFEGNGVIRNYNGKYTTYWEDVKNGTLPLLKAEIKKEAPKQVAPTPVNTKKTEKKLSYSEKKELENIEGDIAKIEDQKSLLEDQISKETDHNKLTELSEQYKEQNELLEQKTLRWMELAD